MISTAYNQAYILHKFKKPDEFTDTLAKRLKMSKSTITFKINLYKLLKKLPLHSNKSIHYFKNFFRQIKLVCRISENQFKNILTE